MRIANLEVVNLQFTYPPGQEFQFAGGCCTGRLSSLIRVTTDSGTMGIGSVYSHPALVRAIVEDQLRDILVGEDPLEVESIWEKSYRVTRWYGRKGAAISALGGIDIALWDIRGKVAGKPIYHLLGAYRDAVPAYASGLLWKNDVEELVDEAARHLSNGFRAMKTRLGKNSDYDRAGLKGIREEIGSENRLLVDGNGRYSVDQVRRLVPDFHAADVFWLEEPFVPEDIDSYLSLRPDLGGIPLAAGENDFGIQGFRELMDRKMVDIVQPDCCRAGGITECRRIGEMATRHGFRVATHTWSDAVALVANMHLIASLPTGITVEVDQTGNPLIDDLLLDRLQVIDGEISMPQGPGLGIELNEDIVEKYTLPHGTPVPQGNYADMVFGRQHCAPAGPYS